MSVTSETLNPLLALEVGDPVNDYMVKTEHTNRKFWEYLNILGLEMPDLICERVLDVGSGTDRWFTRIARVQGIDAVALDPVLPEYRWGNDIGHRELDYYRDRSEQEVRAGILVHAPVQEMPFDDASFDRVVSLYAVPFWLPREAYEEHVDRSFTEILRILKPGGQGNFYPVRTTRPEKCESPSGYEYRTLRGYVPKATLDLLGELGCKPVLRESPYDVRDDDGKPITDWRILNIQKAA